jgi:hypothetical protein
LRALSSFMRSEFPPARIARETFAAVVIDKGIQEVVSCQSPS